MKTLEFLVPDPGMILFNGETYSDCVSLGALDNSDNWREVPLSQYEAYLAEQEAELAKLNEAEPEEPEEAKAESDEGESEAIEDTEQQATH